jgi:hypothetical protein
MFDSSGVADGTRTHDDRNHNPAVNLLASIVASGFRQSAFGMKVPIHPAVLCGSPETVPKS